jgi:predicted kinase
MLLKGYSVIIDNTHLKPSYIVDIISFINERFPVKVKFKIFDTNDKELLKSRISKRDSLQNTDYIDKQVQSLNGIIHYIKDNHSEDIINN